MNTRRLIGIAVAATVTFAVAGCATGSPSSTESVRMAIGTDPSTFDPALARAVDDYTVARLLYDTVLRKDDDGAIIGGLASDWEAKSASEYTFTIRDDATCADGSELTSEMVADSLTRFLDPETGSTARSLVVGSASATVTAENETVAVSLSAPWSDFITGMTLPQAGIVCAAGLEDLEGLAAGTVEGAISGPYTVASAQAAVSYELALREDYDAWPEFAEPLEGTAPETLTLTPIGEQSTIATQLLSGGLDIAALSDESVGRIDGEAGFTTTTSTNATTYVLFNEREGSVFAGAPELRTAVAQLVDREAFNDLISQSRGEALASVSSPQTACVLPDGEALVPMDVDAASSVLNGVTVRLVGSTGFAASVDYLAEIMRNAGATVELQTLDNAAWSTITGGGGSDWDVTLQADLNVVGTLTSSLLRVMGPVAEEGGRNKTGSINEVGYDHLNDAMAATDADARCDAFIEAQLSMLERVDAVPLVSMPTVTVAADGFSIRTFGDYVDVATIRVTE